MAPQKTRRRSRTRRPPRRPERLTINSLYGGLQLEGANVVGAVVLLAAIAAAVLVVLVTVRGWW
jgi:hypothetical protein